MVCLWFVDSFLVIHYALKIGNGRGRRTLYTFIDFGENAVFAMGIIVGLIIFTIILTSLMAFVKKILLVKLFKVELIKKPESNENDIELEAGTTNYKSTNNA